MEQSLYDLFGKSSETLKLDFGPEELAQLAAEKNYTEDQIEAIVELFQQLEARKHEKVVNTLLKLSRLPVKAPKTFENYDFTRLHGKDGDAVRALSNLSELYAGKNVALIGPAGVGKTHLAQAYGRKCCMEGMKAYFLKASELDDLFIQAGNDKTKKARLINRLLKPTCLIIDEIGRRHFDRESTAMFFDLIDRRYEKEGPKCMIFTSNRQPDEWSEYFDGGDSLNAALDRIFDVAKIVTVKGTSYRGQRREILAVEADDDIHQVN